MSEPDYRSELRVNLAEARARLADISAWIGENCVTTFGQPTSIRAREHVESAWRAIGYAEQSLD